MLLAFLPYWSHFFILKKHDKKNNSNNTNFSDLLHRETIFVKIPPIPPPHPLMVWLASRPCPKDDDESAPAGSCLPVKFSPSRSAVFRGTVRRTCAGRRGNISPHPKPKPSAESALHTRKCMIMGNKFDARQLEGPSRNR